MAARYGRFGTGIENWKPNSDKTIWVHKNNPEMKVFIRPNTNRTHNKAKYQVYHTEYAGRGKIVSAPYDYCATMVSARKEATRHLKQWNNPWNW